MPFLVLSLFICPQRPLGILLYLAVAIAARRLPLVATAGLAIAVCLLDIAIGISTLFRLAPRLLLSSLQYMLTLDVTASVTYLAVGAGLMAMLALFVWLLHRFKRRFQTASLIPAVLAAMLMIIFDTAVNGSKTAGTLYILQSPPAFSSATGQTGLTEIPQGTRQQDVLLVLVESLGALDDPRQMNVIWDSFRTPEIAARYDVSTGTTAYKGSTTAGETRELCGDWNDFAAYLDGPHPECLPASYRDAGYKTASFHAFPAEFFSRDEWYPNIGFETSSFMEDLVPTDREFRTCGKTFTGLCDMDLADTIESYLTSPSVAPRLTYWLTLNTHVPFDPADVAPRLGCADSALFDDQTVCHMSEMWMEIFDRIAKIASNPELKPTKILLVGDHAPPLWTRKGRDAFTADQVPWLLLTPKF